MHHDSQQPTPAQSSSPASPQDPLANALKNSVPTTPTVVLPSNAPVAIFKTIEKDNQNTLSVLNNAHTAVIDAYSQAERERASRQKPLLDHIIKLTYIQIIVFNIIIAVIGILSFISFFCGHESALTSFFEVFKYYIGVTVVEFIAMIWFITKGTFSSDHTKSMEMILKGELKNSTSSKDHSAS